MRLDLQFDSMILKMFYLGQALLHHLSNDIHISYFTFLWKLDFAQHVSLFLKYLFACIKSNQALMGLYFLELQNL